MVIHIYTKVLVWFCLIDGLIVDLNVHLWLFWQLLMWPIQYKFSFTFFQVNEQVIFIMPVGNFLQLILSNCSISFEFFPAQYETVSSAYNIMLASVSGICMSLIMSPKKMAPSCLENWPKWQEIAQKKANCVRVSRSYFYTFTESNMTTQNCKKPILNDIPSCTTTPLKILSVHNNWKITKYGTNLLNIEQNEDWQ